MLAIVDKNTKQIVAQNVNFTPKRIKELTGLTTSTAGAPKSIGDFYLVRVEENLTGDASIPLTEIQKQNLYFDEENMRVIQEKIVADVTVDNAKTQLLNQARTVADRIGKHVLFETHWYQADVEARTRIDGAIDWLASGTGPASIEWTTSDNEQVAHTETSLRNLKITGAAHIGSVHYKWISLRDEINASNTVDALRLIDIESGWPNSKPEQEIV